MFQCFTPGISQNSFELKNNKDPIFYFLGFRRCAARDNGMKLLNFRYSGICSSRSCAENRAGLRDLPIKVFGIPKDPKNFYCAPLAAHPLRCKCQFLA